MFVVIPDLSYYIDRLTRQYMTNTSFIYDGLLAITDDTYNQIWEKVENFRPKLMPDMLLLNLQDQAFKKTDMVLREGRDLAVK